MNSNLDNFNTNPQMNNNQIPTNENGFYGNVNQPINIPNQSVPFGNQTNLNQNNFNQPVLNNENKEENLMFEQQQNRFINNNINMENTVLNELNINQTYNNVPKVDYLQDPKVQANLKKKNTITITSEGKVFILIIVVLLLFTFVMPYIFDYFRNAM